MAKKSKKSKTIELSVEMLDYRVPDFHAIITRWIGAHPEVSHARLARESGMSRKTVVEIVYARNLENMKLATIGKLFAAMRKLEGK